MAHICRSCSGRACPLCPGTSDINLFCYHERVVDLNTEIAYGALDFRVAEQELDGPRISRAPVDQGRLRSSQRMRPEQPRIEPDAANPFADQARVLACRHTAISSPAAREKKLAGLLTRCSQVVVDGLTGLVGQLEFDWPPCLFLPNHCSVDCVAIRSNVFHR